MKDNTLVCFFLFVICYSAIWVTVNWNTTEMKKNMQSSMTSQLTMHSICKNQSLIIRLILEWKRIWNFVFVFVHHFWNDTKSWALKSSDLCLLKCFLLFCRGVTVFETASGELVLRDKNKVLGHRSLQIYYKQRPRYLDIYSLEHSHSFLYSCSISFLDHITIRL